MKKTTSAGGWIKDAAAVKSKVDLDALLTPRDGTVNRFVSTQRVTWYTGAEANFYQDFTARVVLSGDKCTATAHAVVPPPRPTVPGDTA
jgi:hypothetical protein